MIKIFIISDDTRIEQERLFLKIVNKFNNFEIYYCVLNNKKEILRTQYDKIIFLGYNEFLLTIKNNKNSSIIYFNYYGNLNNFDFSNNNLIIFGHYLFYKNKLEFKNLKEVNVFDFFRLSKSKENIINLFKGIKVNFISDINYPSAINYLNYRSLKTEENYIYDIFIPLGVGIDYDIIDFILNERQKLKFVVGPVNHPELDFKIFEKFNNGNINNINYFELLSSSVFAENILFSKIILIPLINHSSDLTRISDSLSLGKTIITNKVDCTSHIQNILFYDSLEDLLLKIDNILEQRIYQSKDEYNKIIKYYDENNSIIKLTFELYKFILQHAKPN